MKILTIALDDDADDLFLIGKCFNEAGIEDFSLFSETKDFLKNLTKDVRIVIIDHHLNGQQTCVEVMQKVKDNDRALEKLIPTKIIIISGQNRPDLMKFYSTAGADYLNKNEEGFYDMLVHFVQKNYADIEFKLDMAYRQLARMEETYELLKLPSKDEHQGMGTNS